MNSVDRDRYDRQLRRRRLDLRKTILTLLKLSLVRYGVSQFLDGVFAFEKFRLSRSWVFQDYGDCLYRRNYLISVPLQYLVHDVIGRQGLFSQPFFCFESYVATSLIRPVNKFRADQFVRARKVEFKIVWFAVMYKRASQSCRQLIEREVWSK